MPEVTFVLSPRQGYALRELAETLAAELTDQAVPSTVHVGAMPEAVEGSVPVLMDPWTYVAAEGPDAVGDDAHLRRCVFVCDEPPPEQRDGPHRSLLARAGSVFATDQRSVVALHRLGIPGRLVRGGYAPSLDHYDTGHRDVDVLLLAERTQRREHWLAAAEPALGGLRVAAELHEAPLAEDVESPLARPRWSRLSAARVVVLPHAEDGQRRFAWRAALDAIHAGAVVVAEHGSGITPLQPGRQLFVAAPGALADVAATIARDEARAAAVRADAYERLRSWIPAGLWVSILRAAIVERVGEPVPATA